MGEATSDVIAGRSRVQTVAVASAHLKLVAAAAAWNCGGCVYPSAARQEAEGRGGEGRPAPEPGGGLRAPAWPPRASGPGAFPAALFWAPHTSSPVSPSQWDLRSSFVSADLFSPPTWPLSPPFPPRTSLETLLPRREARQRGSEAGFLAPQSVVVSLSVLDSWPQFVHLPLTAPVLETAVISSPYGTTPHPRGISTPGLCFFFLPGRGRHAFKVRESQIPWRLCLSLVST